MPKKRYPFWLTAVLSLCVFLVVGMSSLNFYSKLKTKELKIQTENLIDISKQVAFSVETALDGYYELLYGISAFIGTEPLVTDEKLHHLHEVAHRQGIYRLGLLSLDGTLSLYGGQYLDISDRPYMRNVRQGERVLTGVRDSRLTNDKMFVLTAPIHNRDGKLLGAVHSSFQLEDFASKSEYQLRSEGYHAHVIDRTGFIILPCGEHESSWTGSSIFAHMTASPDGMPLKDIVRRIAKGEKLQTEIIVRGTESMMGCFIPLQRNNWGCFVTMPMSLAEKHLTLLLDEDVYFLLFNVLGAVGILTCFIILQLRRAAQDEKDLRQGLLANVLGFAEVDVDADRILHCSETPLFQSCKNLPFSKAVSQLVMARVHEDFRNNVIDALSRERIHQMFGEITHSCTVDFMATSDDDELIWMECKINLRKDPSNGHVLVYCILRDINDKKTNEAILRKRAERDALTGLYNRTAGSELIDNYLKNDSFIDTSLHAFIIIDLDNFKDVNDRLGHLTGDQALKDASHIFTQQFRKEDILCRLGGDEFVVFMKDVTLDMVTKKLETVLEALRLSYGRGNVQVNISGSAGFVLAPKNGRFFKELYPRADSALYIAKDAGKGTYREYGADVCND